MLEWSLLEGGNQVRVTTSFGTRVFSRNEWIAVYRKYLKDKVRFGVEDREFIITSCEDELCVMKARNE